MSAEYSRASGSSVGKNPTVQSQSFSSCQYGSKSCLRLVPKVEAALAETNGRISGQSGAATKLGLPARTLDSKIKRLRIKKYGLKVPRATGVNWAGFDFLPSWLVV